MPPLARIGIPRRAGYEELFTTLDSQTLRTIGFRPMLWVPGATRMFVERIVDRKLPGQPFFVRQSHCGKPFGYGAQSDTLGRHVFLSLDVSRAHDQRHALESGIIELVVFDDRFECASLTSVVQLYLSDSR